MVYFDPRAISPKISYFAANDFSTTMSRRDAVADARELSAETLRKIGCSRATRSSRPASILEISFVNRQRSTASAAAEFERAKKFRRARRSHEIRHAF